MAAELEPKPTVDPYEYLQVVLNPDGSLTRKFFIPAVPPTPISDPDNPISVLSKDFTYSPLNDSNWLRIYLPRQDSTAKLPVVFYFHGGGFIIGSAANSFSHNLCAAMASAVPAVVVSVEYRLAPEHRLPAAYDDAVDALHWIKTNWSDVDWLRDRADLSESFLMGTSAGANIAYHAALREAAGNVNDLEPLRIRGLILHQPFFGGTEMTHKEMTSLNDPWLPPSAAGVMWDLSLPAGEDRDHEYCNPTANGGSELLEEIKALGWRVLVTGYDGDTLHDHQTAVVELMEKRGVSVESVFKEGGYHAVELFDASKAEQLHLLIKKFIS